MHFFLIKKGDDKFWSVLFSRGTENEKFSMLHEESLPRPLALDMAEERIEELRSAQEGVNRSRANVASNVSTPDEELSGDLRTR